MSKFQMGDDTDRALAITLAHEYLLCRESFDSFVRYSTMNILGRRDKLTIIRSHDAYARFLSHLYEFYVGCIQMNRLDTSQMNGEVVSDFLNKEVRRILAQRVNAIENGQAPKGENHISTYQVIVPDDFGKQFRRIRNRSSHTIIKRVNPGSDLSLVEFNKKYHKFVYLLFVSAKWTWTIEDIEKEDWMSIEDFDLSVKVDEEIIK